MNDPRSQAQGLAQFGRYGDSMLMHVNPQELQGLQSLAQANGTSLTTNPYTGQPEAFNFGNVLQTALPIAAGYMVGGPMGGTMMGSLAAGAATGAGIAAIRGENVLMGGLMGGMGGYGGHGIGAAAGSVAADTASKSAMSNLGTRNAALAANEQAVASQLMAPNPFTTAGRAAAGAQSGPLHQLAANVPKSASISSPGHPVVSGKEFLPYGGGTAGSSQAITDRYYDALKGPTETLFTQTGDVATELGGGNKLMGYGKMALPVVGAAATGIEPPGLSETDIAATHAFDPTRRLDLEGIDTGLRLLANGGDVGLGGGGDFVAGNFAAGDFAGDDTFGEFAEVTQSGQFDDFNQFNDFANDPLLQNPNNFNPEVNQPLPPINDTQSFTELTETFSPGRFIEGAGDGLSDSIPANIDGQQEARLSDGEFVVPADVVSGIGNGSSDAGSAKLFDMMSKIRKRRTGKLEQPDGIRPSDMAV